MLEKTEQSNSVSKNSSPISGLGQNTKSLTPQDLITQMPVLNAGSIEAKRGEIKAYFNTTYDTYEALFETLKDDAVFYERPCDLRHPLIFYFGHTATFFTNKLALAKLLPQRINPKIESTCAIGVDEMSWDDLNDAHYEWPSVEEVRLYRTKVRQSINDLIDSVAFVFPIDWQSPMWPILMGIEHERIHIETSSVLIRQLPIELVKSHPLFPVCPDHNVAPENTLHTVPAGKIDIDHQDPVETYGWDNEYGQHSADVSEFKAASFLVSNQEYLKFVEADGYQNSEYWDEEGDAWREFTDVKHPTFWVKKDQSWLLRCMAEEIAMPWNWPVEVNCLEAQAFCNWKSKQAGLSIRLPSEDEYLRLRAHSHALNFTDQANVNLQQFASSTPVNLNQTGDFFDVIGNVWQWTQTPIYPFEGFKVHPLYDDFTMPTFDNRHNVMKGGSWISTGNEINGHSRYAFRRHFFQHAGFRYIESDEAVVTEYSTYETDTSVSQYCEFHFGDRYFNVENFAKAYAQKAIQEIKNDADYKERDDLKVLEIGCSVGRASFELATHFKNVVGLDFSARFIQTANQVKENGSIRYSIPIEGEIMTFKEQTLQSFGLNHVVDRCEFFQQDATNLKPNFTGYHMVVAANLIDRLYDPVKFLGMIHQRMNTGGLLMLTSPYTWLEEFTEKQRWLGGFKDAETGENITTLEGLHVILDKEFIRIGKPTDIPFVIRETARKYQHSLAEVTVWKKRS